MNIVRSYPQLQPAILRRRNRIEDEFSRQYIIDYDYKSMETWNESCVILEWDIAVDREDLEQFCIRAAETPDEILVAPYKLYSGDNWTWVHRIVANKATLSTRWIQPSDVECDLFGFGMIYLPKHLIDEYLAAPAFAPHDRRMTDANFSVWYFRTYGKKVPIAWNVRPIHLHYTCPKEWPPVLQTSIEAELTNGA